MPENDTLRDLVGRLGHETAVAGPQPVSYADLHARAFASPRVSARSG